MILPKEDKYYGTKETMREQIIHIVEAIRTTLENTPPELSSDIYDSGIMLAGGGALLGGLDALVTHVTGIRATIAKSPLDAVAVGLGHVIESTGDGDAVQYRNRNSR